MLVVAAMAMVVLLGATALAVDVGRLWETRRELQNAADAAALAGAQDLPASIADAMNDAVVWAGKNGVAPQDVVSTTVSSTYAPDDTISVVVQREVPATFGRVVGMGTTTVTAQASAIVGSVTGGGVMPFGIQDLSGNGTPPFGYVFGQAVQLKDSAGDGVYGNYAELAVDGSGSGNCNTGNPGYLSDICNGGTSNMVEVGEEVNTLTGNRGGPTSSALDTWAQKHNDTMGSVCSTFDGTNYDSFIGANAQCAYRLVLVPVIGNWPSGSSAPVPVEGLAWLYIASWSSGGQGSVNGFFMNQQAPCPATCAHGALNSYGSQVVWLIQ